MVKLAVILAAGLGSRLGRLTSAKPKGLLRVGGEILIERSLHQLHQAGIERVIIGTGHCAEQYQLIAEHRPWISCINNQQYQQTGSMQTLYAMRESIEEDFLLLESDLLYESAALQVLLCDSRANLILASELTQSGDEVYLQLDGQGNLEKLSKNFDDLANSQVEFVGISRVSCLQLQAMCDLYLKQNKIDMHYEEVMALCHGANPFAVQLSKGLLWCEIDEVAHFNRAIVHILPSIRAKEVLDGSLRRNILLNPGPATTSDATKMAQVVPDICPREIEFGQLMEGIANDLTHLVADRATHTSVLFAASGTGAVESVIASVIPPEKTLLVLNNGAYGRRMVAIAKQYGIDTIDFVSPSDTPVSISALRQVLQTSRSEVSHLAVVHNETTTGLLNNLDELGALAANFGIQLIVDAMSSYAAIPIDMKLQQIDYLCASSNKNIQGMAGISFVITSRHNLEQLAGLESRSHYFDLRAQYQSMESTGQMRFTPPVQVLYALRQAIDETKIETVAGRYQRYSENWKILVDGLVQVGLSHLVAKEHHSRIITAIAIPAGMNFDHLHDYMLARGYTIYPGKLQDLDCFRISNIGSLQPADMRTFVGLLADYMSSLGQAYN